MRIIVVGLGVQGKKRRTIAGSDVVATVDPVDAEAEYKRVEEVPCSAYDAAFVCVPDKVKIELLNYLLSAGKHVLVEKPLHAASDVLLRLKHLSRATKAICYTAYNHRFEPHFVRMKELLSSGRMGRIYCVRMFYGNGTARLVRESAWRDDGVGVLADLGSHLLDTALFWFGPSPSGFKVYSANRFENRSLDHVSFGAQGDPVLQMEATLLSWRNHFYADVHAEKGSAHISSLCKWGPSTFIVRNRKLPSGSPSEQRETLVQSDPTWELEYRHFKDVCWNGESNIDNDMWISEKLAGLSRQVSGLG